MRGKPRQILPVEALNRLEALCAKAEHCSWEVRRKLATWKIGADDAEKIVQRLVDHRFVDDGRFARAFARDKFMFSGWGRRKIEAQLRARRIPAALIAKAMDEGIDPAQYETAARALVKRRAAAMADADTYGGRTRLFRAVAARGFEPELVARIIREELKTS